MEEKKFRLWNMIVAAVVFVIATFTYVSTIEPTASFWDCGEFIASSYKLEVGHPPGNPVFQLIARFFTILAPNHPAIAVNIMSALCSSLTIFFLYLTIVFFAKRILPKREDGSYSTGSAIAIMGSGAIGALAYCFSDTFWFSAVEGEVYAMSSLFTAIVFWAMTKWYEQADTPYANRWILLISFLMGLSIGVHLLNLLTIPCMVFLYYYRMREDKPYTFWEFVKIFLIGVVLVGLIFLVLIPYLPKLAAYFDLFFVNTLHLPVNSGAAFFLVAVLGLCFWGAFRTYAKGKVFWNTAIMCLTAIVIGFSVFSIIIIRSGVKPPTNENQPDNAFSLVRYLSREQYGSAPLIYGHYYGSPYADIEYPSYYALVNGKYEKVQGPAEPKYASSGNMLFPRMWNSLDDKYIQFYESYTEGKGRTVPGAKYKKPTMGANLKFFFDFQLNWMYWRYFMWNFAGRQNDIHSPSPGDVFYGNWESGIGPLDRMRLGDQSDAPDILKNNKGKNHYFLLPLLLGLLGLFFQFDRDKRGCWVIFLLFFMTGIAIVLYLNQNPYQVRERDYAYAGSFYAFAVWIGFGVAALYSWLSSLAKDKSDAIIGAAVSIVCLFVPGIMAAQNWDDHDRSNRATSTEMAKNYLSTAGEQGYLVTHGDNDTFPLWYAQEVEGCRTDVRILNTSLLGTDWHIDQMRYAVNESKPLPLQIPQRQYLYGTNDWVQIYDTRNTVVPISEVVKVFKHPDAKIALEDGSRVDYIVSRKMSVPVDRENVIKYGILPESLKDSIPDQIVLEIPKGRNYITKQELFFIDLLSTYKWDRKLSFLSNGGDINMGIKDYLMYDGYSSHLIPIKNRITNTSIGIVDADDLYDRIMNKMSWEAVSRKGYYVDYQNLYTFLGVLPQREFFYNAANAMLEKKDTVKCEQILDKCISDFPNENFPYESISVGFYNNDLMVIRIIDLYYRIGRPEKAKAIQDVYSEELFETTKFFLEYYDLAQRDFELCSNCLYYLCDTLKINGQKEAADNIMKKFEAMLKEIVG